VTKKQTIFAGIVFIILIILIVGTIFYAGTNNKKEQGKTQGKVSEVKVERRNIPQPDISDVLPERNQESSAGETGETNKSGSSQTTQSVSWSDDLLRKTIETAPPRKVVILFQKHIPSMK